jgi:predicted Zn-dependent peptidase
MKKIFFALPLICFAVVAIAQPQATPLDRSKRPEASAAPEIKMGQIQSFELSNGLKVFVVENHKVPTVAFSLALNIRPELEKEAAGTADITAQLITSGTQNRSKDQLDNDIDFIGATLTASAKNIYAAALKKHQNKLLELMSDVLLNNKFTQEELDKIKNQTLSGLATQKDDPDAISKNVKAVLNFGKKHPYGEITAESSVEKVTLDLCNRYFKTYYRPNVAYLAVVGDITPEEAKPLIEKYFGAWQKADVPQTVYPTPAAPDKTTVAFVNKTGAVQSVINVTYPVDLKPNSEDVIKARVMNTILGAGFSSRLFMNLREKHSYTYGSYSALDNDELAGEFSAYAKVRNAVTDSAVYQILYELNRIRTEKVSQEELDGIKNFLTGNFAIALEDPQTVAKFAINIDRYNLPKDYYQTYLKKIAAVTIDDVFQMAQKYIRPENATILVVGDKEKVAKSLERYSAYNTIKYYDNYGNSVAANFKPIPQGLTAKKVVDAYIKAIGGEKALNKISDITIKRTADTQYGKVSLTTKQKAPNKYNMTAKMGIMTIQEVTFDGAKAKSKGMQGKKEIVGDELEELKEDAIINQEMQYEKLGYKLNLKGIEEINGKECYVLELVSAKGKKTTEWYDVQTGLKVRVAKTITTEQGTTVQQSDLLEYKEIEGIKYPNVVSTTIGPMPIKLMLESVEVNKKIKDSEFTVD